MKTQKHIQLNNKDIIIEAEPSRRFLDVLREDLDLTGTKEGCGEGECGACSIIVNGDVVNSCLILFGQLQDGDKILTVEGLAQDNKLNRLQESFLEHGAVHCGACIPGMLMASTALLMKNPDPSEDEIKEAIAGNLCRCTGYGKIVEAIKGANG